jgi:hypothetical protein
MEYQEKIICGKCKTQHNREMEVIEAYGSHFELDQPLKIIVVKKFECKKCKENKEFSVEIIQKKKSKKEAI